MIKIIQAKTEEHIKQAHILFRKYEKHLGVDLYFQGFEDELAGLPGKYAAPKGCILIAIEDDTAIGCVALRPIEQSICEMKRLYVQSDYRNTGLGHILVDRIIKKAKELGYNFMRLDTLNTLKEAMRLYQKFGFKKIGSYYHNPLPGTIFWELILT